jgi:hypothetical protein
MPESGYSAQPSGSCSKTGPMAKASRGFLVKYLNERTPSNLGAPLSSLPRFQQSVGEIDALIYDSERLPYGFAVCFDTAHRIAAEGGVPTDVLRPGAHAARGLRAHRRGESGAWCQLSLSSMSSVKAQGPVLSRPDGCGLPPTRTRSQGRAPSS